ncbi:MAG TPA: hypothetical protein DDY78_15090 [Planctomycetales bacterium]|jgi:hypothetical protein|nr:hypothetical protein [Planctomycetales bacterium]
MSRTPFLSNAGVTTKPEPKEETRTRLLPPYNVIWKSVNLQLTPVVNNVPFAPIGGVWCKTSLKDKGASPADRPWRGQFRF